MTWQFGGIVESMTRDDANLGAFLLYSSSRLSEVPS